MLQYFEELYLDSLRSAVQDEVNITGCGATGGPVTLFNIIYYQKTAEIKKVGARHVK